LEKIFPQKIIKKYDTNDPFKIAKTKNINVICTNLGPTTWGFRIREKRISVIYVNNQLKRHKRYYALAHELGHEFLHPHINTPFLRTNTLFSVSKVEKEAHRFGVHLLIGMKTAEYGETVEDFLFRCCIPREMHIFY